jgi:hypothetical protein
MHDTIVVRNQFSVGIDLTMLSAGDTVGLISTSDGDATGSYSAWELTANNEWFTVEHGVYSWGLEVDLAIFPVIDADDPAGVINMRDGLLSVYPNPCNDILFINVTNSDMSQVSIHDLTGRNITDQITIRGKNSIDVSQLNTGFYVITLSDAQFSRSTKILKTQ